MKHVMLDIETFGGSPNGCLVEIGAVAFSFEEGIVQGSRFSKCVDPESSQKKGMTIDASTVEFWFAQGGYKPCAKQVGLRQALENFSNYWNWKGLEGVWTNAPLFDFAILRRAYELCDLKCPWHYRQERCSRTLFWAANQNGKVALPERAGVHHRAVDDAEHQAIVAVLLWDKLNK